MGRPGRTDHPFVGATAGVTGEPHRRGRIFNLVFHGVGTPPDSCSEDEQVTWLPSETFVTMLDAIAGRRDVHVTLDDGNRSDIEVALPALVERELQATFFVVADRIGRPGYTSATDLNQISRAGMAVGSHGLSHHSWRELHPARLSRELHDSRALIEEVTGARVDAAACPFGDYNRRVLRVARDVGYGRLFTSDGGPASVRQWLQPRTSLRRSDSEAVIEEITSFSAFHDVAHSLKRCVKGLR